MANKTYFLANAELNAVLRNTALQAPATMYVALFTVMPTSPTGTGGTECSGGGYARQSFSSTNFAAASNGSTSNGSTITFGTPTSPGWGTAVGFGIYDAASAGNLYWYDTFAGTNDVWTLTLGTQTSGTFTMTVNGNATADAAWTLPYNPTAALILEYLESIAAVGAGNVTVTGSGPWTITFVNAMGAQSVTMAGTFTSLGTPGNASLTHTTTGSTGSLVIGTGAVVSFAAGALALSES